MAGSHKRVTVALDWLPNTNHLGFYVAKARGLYEATGLDVVLLSTSDKEYQTSYGEAGADGSAAATSTKEAAKDPQPFVTPCSKVADRSADFGLNSPEGVVNWNTTPGQPTLKAVAACLQRPTSAVVTLASSRLTRPADLDGKVYASYGARYEGRIVQKMIQADGGAGDFQEQVLPMLGIFNSLVTGKADATWVFLGWEGVQAKRKGVQLNAFEPQEFGIPYAYAPCLVAHPDFLAAEGSVVKAFLAASEEGWRLACADPKAAAADLVRLAKADSGVELDAGMCEESASYIATKALTTEAGAGQWGRMDPEVWAAYLGWLDTNGLLTTAKQSRHPDADDNSVSLDQLRAGEVGQMIPLASIPVVFTNDFLPGE